MMRLKAPVFVCLGSRKAASVVRLSTPHDREDPLRAAGHAIRASRRRCAGRRAWLSSRE